MPKPGSNQEARPIIAECEGLTVSLNFHFCKILGFSYPSITVSKDDLKTPNKINEKNLNYNIGVGIMIIAEAE